jgi:hypothetical protein
MNLGFDLNAVKTTEFGVGRDNAGNRSFTAVPVDDQVQVALGEMARATWEAMQRDESGPTKYEPSEKHGSTEYLYLPLNHDLTLAMQDLHNAKNLSLDGNALKETASIFCYFARFTDKNGKRLTALRRATQFKGVLKTRLIRFVTDTLKLVEDDVFKLDNDFDLLVDEKHVHILRPSGFEFAGQLQQAILDAVPANIKEIRKDLAFVDFSVIESFAAKHPRAARCLASIRSQGETKNIDKSALKKHCKNTGVEVSVSNGKITVASGHEMGFLEVLDRRRYEQNLVKGQAERFKATSRKKINE